jgi:hypothetical protein
LYCLNATGRLKPFSDGLLLHFKSLTHHFFKRPHNSLHAVHAHIVQQGRGISANATQQTAAFAQAARHPENIG